MADKQPDLHVRFDLVDVGHAARNLTATSSIDDLSTAEFVLDLDAVVNDPVDYLAEVRISVVWEGDEQLIFTGTVISATPGETGVSLKCQAAVALGEQLVPPFGVWNVKTADLVYLITRLAGFPEERLQIDGLEELPIEAFEVVAPLENVSVEAPTRVGAVLLVPSSDGERFLRRRSPAPELKERFLAGEAFCVACVTAKTIFEAEQAGLTEIETVMAWLAGRARYGLARLPGGEPLSFSRLHALNQASYVPVVAGFGLTTTRTWVRSLTPAEGRDPLPLHEFLLPSLPAWLTLQDRQALLACRRAVTETDSLRRVGALWEAIEFYASGASAPKIFSRADLRALRQSVGDLELSEHQRARVTDLLSTLNSAPLFVRLRIALDRDGVPVTEGELQLLKRLRQLRNDAAHGRGASPPLAEEAEHAVSVVARMLAFRLHRQTFDKR